MLPKEYEEKKAEFMDLVRQIKKHEALLRNTKLVSVDRAKCLKELAGIRNQICVLQFELEELESETRKDE